ncbi:MAG: CapA family protein [Caryophanon sp.]|nr:CapA family protein [Caryophanon sp.]
MKKLLTAITLSLALLAGCSEDQSIEKESPTPAPTEDVTPEPEPTPITVNIAMIGDVLLHRGIALYDDYTPSFEPVKEMLTQYDYLIANQESAPIANKFGVIGYPRFSSPPRILDTLHYVGVDIVNLANNHTVDWGEEGVQTIFENLEKHNMPYFGAYKSDEDRYTPRIIDIDGVTVGLLGYTYGTNGYYLPEGSPYNVNYIVEEKMLADIENLEPLVDVVAVSMHWGPEYVTTENEEQRRLAKVLNDAGVEIVFGSHPHILQPYTLLTNTQGEKTHVFYSIGNFFATITSAPDTFIGGAASVEITKTGDDIDVHSPHFKATSMIVENGRYNIHPLANVEHAAPRNLDWVRSVLGPDVTVE